MNTLKLFSAILLLPSLLLGTHIAHAAEAKVQWQDFKTYRDVMPANQTRKSFHQQVAKSLEKHIAKQAKKLPQDQTLKLTVTDVDLAGDVNFGMQEVRVVRSIFYPRIKLDYQVLDKQGNTISQGKADLKDMRFLDRIGTARSESFKHEKRLITDWIDDELLPQLTLLASK